MKLVKWWDYKAWLLKDISTRGFQLWMIKWYILIIATIVFCEDFQYWTDDQDKDEFRIKIGMKPDFNC